MNISNLEELITLLTAIFGLLTTIASFIKQKRDDRKEARLSSQNQTIKNISTNGNNSNIHITAQQMNYNRYFQTKENEIEAEEYSESFAANKNFTKVFYIMIVISSFALVTYLFKPNGWQKMSVDTFKLATSLLAVITVIIVVYGLWRIIIKKEGIVSNQNFFINGTRFLQILVMPIGIAISQVATWFFVYNNIVFIDNKSLYFCILFLITSYQFFVATTQIFWNNIYRISFKKNTRCLVVYRLLLINFSISALFILLIFLHLTKH